MQNIHRVISRFSTVNAVRLVKEKSKPSFGNDTRLLNNVIGAYQVISRRGFSTNSGGGENEGNDDWGSVKGGTFGASAADDLGWDSVPSWSTGMTKDHFDGEAVHQKTDSGSNVDGEVKSLDFKLISKLQEIEDVLRKLEEDNKKGRASEEGWDDEKINEARVLLKQLREGHTTDSSSTAELNALKAALLSDFQEIDDKCGEMEEEIKKGQAFLNGQEERMQEMSVLMKQIREPGARGSYLKDSEKAEMYRLHKENPEVYTVEKLAKDYRIMRQRVHAILWLKELEEEEEKKLGHPLDDSVELLLDTCPEFFNSHDREFHVASLPYKPDFKVMPEGWDGTIKDLDEVHYEISMKEDEMLYQEFVQKMNFNKMKMAGQVKCHKYSRRRPSEGWNFTVEKMGSRGKRGGGGGWKFVSLPDGSTRPLNESEKMYVRRETPRRRRKILP